MKRFLKHLVKRLPGMKRLDRVLRRHYTGADRPDPALRGCWGSPLPGYEEMSERADDLFRKDVTLGEELRLRESEQMALLRELAVLANDFDWPAEPQPDRRFHHQNGWYDECDALVLFAMLRRFRPARIIEVGSGHSSALMLDSNERWLGGSVRMTFIEPNPERLLRLLRAEDQERVEVLTQPVQQVPLDRFAELGTNDLLFIDSSHVGKIGSDVLYELFQVLPRVGSGCLIHFHDIFWPFEYPREWLEGGRAWNEAYLLRAFLQYNEAFDLLLFNDFLQDRHANEVREFFPRFLNTTSSSLWLVKR